MARPIYVDWIYVDRCYIAAEAGSRAGFADAAATDLALRWLPADVVGAFA